MNKQGARVHRFVRTRLMDHEHRMHQLVARTCVTSSCDTDLTAVVSLQESAFALGIFLDLVSSEIEDMLQECTSHSGATRQGIQLHISTKKEELGEEEYSKSDTASGQPPKRSGRRPRLLHLPLEAVHCGKTTP